MRKTHLRILGIILSILGIFFLLNSKINITGAVIDSPSISSTFSSVLGILLILVSLILFMFGENLEEKLEEGPEPTAEDYPLIIDTNYLIDACKDRDTYKDLVRLIRIYRDRGNPIYIPSEVMRELNPTKARDKGQKALQSQLKKIIKENTMRLEEDHPKYNNLKGKNKYKKIAKSLLEKTPKYITYLYLNEIKKGNTINTADFIKNNKSKLDGSYSVSDYLVTLNRGKREYERELDKGKLMHRYDLSEGDIEILANSLHLQNRPHKYGNKELDKIKILSADEHLLQVEKIFDNKFKKRKGKIIVRSRYN